MRIRLLPATLVLLALPAPVHADSPYVVLRDDGTVEDNAYRTADDVNEVASFLIDAYLAEGAPTPSVMSVWSAFPLGGQSLFTLFLPFGNDITGIGLDNEYGGRDGTFPSPLPPLHSILLHNDVTDMPARADRHEAPLDGYARYLFLLELTHTWGPAARIPGDDADGLIGFPFHWSFWMDAGGSPAGGNAWIDNGDGTFTTAAAAPATVRYSMLDLYLLGLADASEVPPFGLLEDAEAPARTEDPLNGGEVSGATFPWFAEEPLTVTATRRTLTIDDVVAENGARDPAFGEAPDTMTVGIVLVVRADTSDDDLAALRSDFDVVAGSLAPAFEDATDGRGHLEIVTSTEPDEPDPVEPDAGAPAADDAGPAAPDAAAGEQDAGPEEPQDDGDGSGGCGCTVASRPQRAAPALFLALLLAALRRARARS